MEELERFIPHAYVILALQTIQVKKERVGDQMYQIILIGYILEIHSAMIIIIYCVLQNHEKTTVVVKVRIRFDPKVLGNEITSRTT